MKKRGRIGLYSAKVSQLLLYICSIWSTEVPCLVILETSSHIRFLKKIIKNLWKWIVLLGRLLPIVVLAIL